MICPECGNELQSVTLYRAINAEETWFITDLGDGTYSMEFGETDQENGDNGATVFCKDCGERLYDLEHQYPADAERIPVLYEALETDDQETA